MLRWQTIEEATVQPTIPTSQLVTDRIATLQAAAEGTRARRLVRRARRRALRRQGATP